MFIGQNLENNFQNPLFSVTSGSWKPAVPITNCGFIRYLISTTDIGLCREINCRKIHLLCILQNATENVAFVFYLAFVQLYPVLYRPR